jgi:peptidoglycan/xylan/chitin deacetylase (PgdA/CDA1 family)
MYHYVRDVRSARFPRLRALDITNFRRQLDYLQANFRPIAMQDLLASLKAETVLPDKACLLTFDDGYRDHYEWVFPELRHRGIAGAFFPPAKAVLDRELLDVNKIQLILASTDDADRLLQELADLYKCFRLERETGLSWDHCEGYRNGNRFDSKAVAFFKRMLQAELPEKWRRQFTDILLEKYVTADPAALGNEFYLSRDELCRMIEEGMYVGSHGYRHVWLDQQTLLQQAEEIDRSLLFLRDLGISLREWVMCYPYGAYNAVTLELLEKRNCAAALTTKVGVAHLGSHCRLELPRLDTNDLPQ